MKPEWLEYLADPLDGTKLNLAEFTEQQNGRIITGTLASESGHYVVARAGTSLRGS